MIWLDETPSTNSYLSSLISTAENPLPDLTAIAAGKQSAGRGQRGNFWEAEPGKNLTLSVLYYPPETLRPIEQFSISEATALAVADTLADFGIEAMVKWPNDIYVEDRKICGILIEHSLIGLTIRHSILGIGLNVNQTRFISDAPNPVSMMQIIGADTFDIEEVASRLLSHLEKRLSLCATTDNRKILHTDFLKHLWRGDGRYYPFRERATGREFLASIINIEPSGLLLLSNGGRYAFKEIEFLLKR